MNTKVRQMRMVSHLNEEKVRAYSGLIEEFSDVFAWSYEKLKGIEPEMVEHCIPLILGTKPIMQKEKRMNPQLQLIVKAELERLLKTGFIRPVEITDWVSPMVLVRKNNGKMRVCVDYRKFNACTQKNHFSLHFISLLLGRGGDSCALHFYGWVHQLQSNIHSTRGLAQNNLYDPMRNFQLVNCAL